VNDTLHFDAASHTYSVGGVIVPSVTTVIGAVCPWLYDHSSDFARERGSVVHEVCQLHDEGDLDESTVHPICAGFFEGWKRFLAESKFQIVANERRIYSPTYGFAGTLDRVGILNGNLVLIDLKTGDPGWQVALQTAAYQFAYQEETGELVDERYGCWLHEDGTYTLTGPYLDHDRDFSNFVFLLGTYRLWQQHAPTRFTEKAA
jgi:hypothetical protein